MTITRHTVWNSLFQLLDEIEPCKIAKQHLESCNYNIQGYWDSENRFYEQVTLLDSPTITLVNSAIGINQVNEKAVPWIKLEFLLTPYHSEDEEIGELTLVLDTRLNIIDENWCLDLDSPVVAISENAELKVGWAGSFGSN